MELQLEPPWSEGGKERCLHKMNIGMTHDELAEYLGDTVMRVIQDAGFVLVPKQWREDTFSALHELAERRRAGKE
jgi:hypothetical protein